MKTYVVGNEIVSHFFWHFVLYTARWNGALVACHTL